MKAAEVKVVEDADYVCASEAEEAEEEASEWWSLWFYQASASLSLPPLLLTHSLSLSDYWALEVRATEMKAQFIVGAFLPSCPTLLLVLHFVLYYTHFIIYRVSQQVLDGNLAKKSLNVA